MDKCIRKILGQLGQEARAKALPSLWLNVDIFAYCDGSYRPDYTHRICSISVAEAKTIARKGIEGCVGQTLYLFVDGVRVGEVWN